MKSRPKKSIKRPRICPAKTPKYRDEAHHEAAKKAILDVIDQQLPWAENLLDMGSIHTVIWVDRLMGEAEIEFPPHGLMGTFNPSDWVAWWVHKALPNFEVTIKLSHSTVIEIACGDDEFEDSDTGIIFNFDLTGDCFDTWQKRFARVRTFFDQEAEAIVGQFVDSERKRIEEELSFDLELANDIVTAAAAKAAAAIAPSAMDTTIPGEEEEEEEDGNKEEDKGNAALGEGPGLDAVALRLSRLHDVCIELPSEVCPGEMYASTIPELDDFVSSIRRGKLLWED